MNITYGEFKGSKTMTIEDEDAPMPVKMTFGRTKARLIIANINAIKEFAESKD